MRMMAQNNERGVELNTYNIVDTHSYIFAIIEGRNWNMARFPGQEDSERLILLD